MKPNLSKIKKIITDSFLEVYRSRSKFDNSQKSSRFLTIVSSKIHSEWYKGKKLNIQTTDENGISKSGEWLYDMCITEQIQIQDEKYLDSTAMINTKVLFAMECEFSTSIKEFAQDFGKLLCSNSEYILYIQGLNQESDYYEDFIKRRKSIIENKFSHIKKRLFLAFVPSPEKTSKNKSFWDFHHNPETLIHVF